ncbi:hypothetical protein CROQUDRAFT_132132 [Cronartium quercuum f. sp. fusiforme G11]|uniref:Uncharacterized protein n=1 Tax=Cronartium quercuum f. sp. fusiforme G11 TaxID=708437 RepID=A0A9P6NPY3_9BASI|nr:hypothetical protein CROQUDRAFT_132132 [Cronartium quercuum f. sp. fusiforme G11]
MLGSTLIRIVSSFQLIGPFSGTICMNIRPEILQNPTEVSTTLKYSKQTPKLGLDGQLIQDTHEWHSKRVVIHNLRTEEKRPDLESDGLTYVTNRRVEGLDEFVASGNEEMIEERLGHDSIQLVKQLTGAKVAVALLPKIRRNTKEESSQPVRYVHSDFTLESVKTTLRLYSKIPRAYVSKATDKTSLQVLKTEIKKGKRVVIITVWRPLEPVESMPLAVASWNSIDINEDLLDSSRSTMNTQGQQLWRYNKNHNWFYISKQKPSEVLLFMQHDRAGTDGHGIHLPHASFTDPDSIENARGRFSFEVRIAAIVESKFNPQSNFKIWGPHAGFKFDLEMSRDQPEAQYSSWKRQYLLDVEAWRSLRLEIEKPHESPIEEEESEA